MCLITRLKVANRRATRTFVELDDAPWAELDTEVVLRHQLSKGQVLSPAEQAALLAEDAFIRARRTAAILLRTRPRSIFELRHRLTERKYEPVTVEQVVAYYEEKGDLDDARFAEIFVSHQLKTRPDGPRRIATQLRQLGVADNLIQAALEKADATDTELQTERARQFIERRLRRLSDADPRKRRRKLTDALIRAGFEPAVYAPLLREMLQREPDEDFPELTEESE